MVLLCRSGSRQATKLLSRCTLRWRRARPGICVAAGQHVRAAVHGGVVLLGLVLLLLAGMVRIRAARILLGR